MLHDGAGVAVKFGIERAATYFPEPSEQVGPSTFEEQHPNARSAELKEGEAAPGDAVNCTISYSWSGGEIPGTTEEYLILLRTLDFPDATLDGFDTLMTGVKAGETRTATVDRKSTRLNSSH